MCVKLVKAAWRVDCINTTFQVVIFTIVMQDVPAGETDLRLYRSSLMSELLSTSKDKVKNSGE